MQWLWHTGCNIQAPFSHHINFCLSQQAVSRILPSRNRQLLIATVQAKTFPTFCMRLNASTANLQAHLHRFLGNSNTGGFSWNLMDVKGGKLILNNSAEHVLLPGFLLCPHKPFWNCLASYQCMGSGAASTASFRYHKNNESGHQNTVLKSSAACWVFWGYWEKIEVSFPGEKGAGISKETWKEAKIAKQLFDSRCWGFNRYKK